jgi:hypothetical protein
MAEAGADSESTKKPFFERSLFKAAVAVVGLLGAVWALLGAPKPWDVAKDITAAAPLPLKNTEIVLDASAHMGEPFGRVTKYDIAATEAARWAISDEEAGLALRVAGGTCNEPGRPLVDFGKSNSAEVREAALEQKPAGKSNFAAAVRAAITDFSEAEFKRPGSENQVMVFLGGDDECWGVPGEEIRDELEQSGVKTVFRFFALKVSKETKKNLAVMERQLRPVARVEVREANTLGQVQQAVNEVKEEEAEEAAGAEPRQVQAEPESSPEADSSSAEQEEGGGEEAEGKTTEEAEGKTTEEPEPAEEPEHVEEPEPEPEAEEAPEPVEEAPSEAESLEAPKEAEEVPKDGAAPAPRKDLSSVSGYRPMTLSWTLRPSGSCRRGKSPSLYWASCWGSWSSMPS